MAADSTGKVTSGAPFRPPPANLWNNMVDAGRAFADGQFSASGGPPTRARQTDLLKLKNSSGAMRRKGEILKIDGKVVTDVVDEFIWLDGVAVTDDCRFGILKKPAEASEVVVAQVSGVCMALVNVTDEEHTFATAAADEYVLQSGDSGPLEILYAPEGTGEKECVVRFAGGVAAEGDIFFKPKAVAPDFGFSCDAVLADVVRAPCNSSVQVGDEVLVIDSSPNFGIDPNGYFRLPENVLFVSAYGWAEKMKSYESERYELGLGACVYIVKHMRCVEPVSYE